MFGPTTFNLNKQDPGVCSEADSQSAGLVRVEASEPAAGQPPLTGLVKHAASVTSRLTITGAGRGGAGTDKTLSQ